MPFYQVWATVHHEATCVIEANDQDHAVAIATALSGIGKASHQNHTGLSSLCKTHSSPFPSREQTCPESPDSGQFCLGWASMAMAGTACFAKNQP